MSCGCGAGQKVGIKGASTSFLSEPIRLTLPTDSGLLELQYNEGDWVPTGGVPNREAKALRAEVERLRKENVELKKKLDRAIDLIAGLRLDMEKMEKSGRVSIVYRREEDKDHFQSTHMTVKTPDDYLMTGGRTSGRR